MFERAQIGDPRRQNSGEFLRLAGAGLVPGPAVGKQRRSCEARCFGFRKKVGEGAEVDAGALSSGEADRIVAEIDAQPRAGQRAPRDEGGECLGDCKRVGAGIEAEIDEV